MKATKTPDVRVIAAQALQLVLHKGQSLTAVLPDYAKDLNAQDKGFLQELCFGVCRFLPRYQALISPLLKKPFKPKDADLQALLYIGAHQLLTLRTPDHAAISATVNAAKALKKQWAAGLVNAVLRNLQRGATQNFENSNDPETQYAHPAWFIQRVQRAWPKDWPALLEANNAQAPMTLRVNLGQNSRPDYLKQLSTRELAADAGIYADTSLYLQTPSDATALPAFATGAVSVQDEAAQLAASLLDLAPGQRVLDACCAPGGKTCHMLEHTPGLREVVAVDCDASRLERVSDNLQRLRLDATLKAADLADINAWWDGAPFDRILLDAPCSATGVIRRHPDIKVLRRDSDIQKLATLQSQLLETVWQTLAPGGKLVYATCSVLPDENEQIIEAFVQQRTDVKHEEIKVSCGQARPYGRQLFPQVGGHDGFYYAVLVKAC